MFGDSEFPSYEQIVDEYSREFARYVTPEGPTVFGFWMQTLADMALLDLELKGLTEEYSVDPISRTVDFTGDAKELRTRVAHLERVNSENTLYTELVDLYGDTNAYAFHNLYPFKGKFYPRVVRTLANAFSLNSGHKVLDPFNGSGTTTHELSLMNIEGTGVDLTPMGHILATVKNELPFLDGDSLEFKRHDLEEIINLIEEKRCEHKNPGIYFLMLIIYFDTVDAFARTSRYDRKGKVGLFIEKFEYIKDCYKKLISIKEKYSLEFRKADVSRADALDLRNFSDFEGKFDAVITSPPYYFSIDYVGKDKIAYDYLGVDMKEVESRYLGMKNSSVPKRMGEMGSLPPKVVQYYLDLRESISLMFWALKPGGKLAIVVGDSSVSGKKIPTTMMTKRFCEEVGFHFGTLIFNPLLGARNRAIRGESIIICTKQED